MKKIFSSDDSKEKVYEDFSQLLGDNKEILYIPFARKYEESDAYEDDIKSKFGCVSINQIKTIKSVKDIAEEDLSKYGAIYIDDGNVYKLLFELKVNGGLDAFKKYADNGGIICGVGAGALCLADDVKLISNEDENKVGLIDTKGFNFVDAQQMIDTYSSYPLGIIFKGENDMEEREVKPFTMWRHFKGSRAMVITVANHSETGESLVVYRCMDNNGNTNHKDGIYARPISMFLSEVDHEKYPDVTQKYRFEEIKD